MIFMRSLFICLIAGVIASAGCSVTPDSGDFTRAELEVIREDAGDDGATAIHQKMRVLKIDNPEDLLVLRAQSRNLSSKALLSEDYALLCSKMIATVTHPSEDGVGIAGPQVGLNRRVVAVQRFDKKGEPFEVYPNISIVWASDSLSLGTEGCLSVPDRRGEVLRSGEIVVEYADIAALSGICDPKADIADGKIPMVRDTVRDFTAVIFQHEIDHLDGILYIDRLQ